MGMPVSELVDRISTEELRSWAAYEQVCGPLDGRRAENLMNGIHEQVQTSNWLMAEKMYAGKREDGRIYPNPFGPEMFRALPRTGDDFRPGPGDIVSGVMSAEALSKLDALMDEDKQNDD